MLLDTTVIIDLVENDKGAIQRLKELEEENIPLVTTTITLFEIWKGAHRLLGTPEQEKMQDIFDLLEVFLFDIPSAKEAGKIYSLLRKDGKMIQPEDCMIAGIAKTKNEPILTRNVKHFERIQGLKIEAY